MPGWLSWVHPAGPKFASSQDEALRRLKIRHFDEDILEMKIADLRRHFGYETSRRIHIEVFFRNVIWQIHEQIQAGRLPRFYEKRGYIRGMWYYIKSRIDHYKPLRQNRYGSMISALADLVYAGLVSYRDFNFRDRDANLRKLGTDNPHILLYAEKDGFISILEEFHELYGCTIATLGGAPSLMSSNYLVSEMVEAGLDLSREFVCFSLVDFDPKGWDAARDFLGHLDLFGLKNPHRFRQYGQLDNRLDLIQPKNLTPEDMARRYTLPVSMQNDDLCVEWAALTGGVDGRGSRKYGIESDEFTQERIAQLFDQAVAPFLNTPPELVQRRARMRELEKAATDFMVYKMLHPKRPPSPRSPQPHLPPPPAAHQLDPPLPRQPAARPTSKSVRRRVATQRRSNRLPSQ